MKSYMICVSGFSGVGKDEFCKPIIRDFGFHHIGWVDPAKRHMRDLYDFSEQQLFGESKYRNAGDVRYPKSFFFRAGVTPLNDKGNTDGPLSNSSKNLYYLKEIIFDKGNEPAPILYSQHKETKDFSNFITISGKIYPVIEEGDPFFWLSPRETLQKYCELMNEMYLNSWVQKGIKTHKALSTGLYSYSKMDGITRRVSSSLCSIHSCFSDFRHIHEFNGVREQSGNDLNPIFIRIKSKRVPNPPYKHKSEVEQTSIPDSEFDFVINNDGTIEDLHNEARKIISGLNI